MFFKFPYTDLYSLNLDWMIKYLEETKASLEEWQEIIEGLGSIVHSVNGQTGTVQLGTLVNSVNGQTGTVQLGTLVNSVNGKTGAVNIDNDDINELGIEVVLQTTDAAETFTPAVVMPLFASGIRFIIINDKEFYSISADGSKTLFDPFKDQNLITAQNHAPTQQEAETYYNQGIRFVQSTVSDVKRLWALEKIGNNILAYDLNETNGANIFNEIDASESITDYSQPTLQEIYKSGQRILFQDTANGIRKFYALLGNEVNGYTGYIEYDPVAYFDQQWVPTLQQELSNLQSAVDDCFIFSHVVYTQIDNDSASVSEYKENGNRGYIDYRGIFIEQANYATFLYDVTEDGQVWFDTTSGIAFLSVFSEHQIGTNNFVVRYRQEDNNLPDASSKLSVTEGQMLAITVTVNNAAVYSTFVLNVPASDDTILLTNDVHFNTAQRDDIASIAKTVKRPTGTITLSGTDFVITNRNARYTVRRFDNSGIRAYLWRIYKCEIANGSQWVTLWETSDADGVVRISGEDDFIGGYHGDETETAFSVYIDGVLLTESAYSGTYTTIEMYQESDVYHCNTSQIPNVVAFKRNKILRFDDQGCHICNQWIAQGALDLQFAYMGMLSINRYISGTSGNYLITGYHTNKDFKYVDADTSTPDNHDITDVVISTAYGDTEIKMSYITDNNDYYAHVADYDTESSQRLKVYAGLGSVTVPDGYVIRAEATIII